MMIPEITVMSTAVTMKADTMTHPTMMVIQNKKYINTGKNLGEGECASAHSSFCVWS